MSVMTPAQRLVAQMQAQRTVWLELPSGKALQLLRPRETEMLDFMRRDGEGRFETFADLVHVKRFVTGWRGYTEADLVGPAGSSDEAPFTPELWAEVCADDVRLTTQVAEKLLALVCDHAERMAEDAKN